MRMTKSHAAKITVKAVAPVTLTDFHIRKSEEAGAAEKVRPHETSARERVQR